MQLFTIIYQTFIGANFTLCFLSFSENNFHTGLNTSKPQQLLITFFLQYTQVVIYKSRMEVKRTEVLLIFFISINTGRGQGPPSRQKKSEKQIWLHHQPYDVCLCLSVCVYVHMCALGRKIDTKIFKQTKSSLIFLKLNSFNSFYVTFAYLFLHQFLQRFDDPHWTH